MTVAGGGMWRRGLHATHELDALTTRLFDLLPVRKHVAPSPYVDLGALLDALDCSAPLSVDYSADEAFHLLWARAERNGTITWSGQLTKHAGNAWISPRTRRWEIKLSTRRGSMQADPATRLSVLAHEIGHCYLGHGGVGPRARNMSRSVKEWEAELFGYCMLLALNMDFARERAADIFESGYCGQWKPDVYGIDLTLLRANAFLFVRNALKGGG